jgi:hypothetical protein
MRKCYVAKIVKGEVFCACQSEKLRLNNHKVILLRLVKNHREPKEKGRTR